MGHRPTRWDQIRIFFDLMDVCGTATEIMPTNKHLVTPQVLPYSFEHYILSRVNMVQFGYGGLIGLKDLQSDGA
jgi:hypothetical protein